MIDKSPDEMWKPVYFVWMDDKGWERYYYNTDSIRVFETVKEAKKYIKYFHLKYSVIKTIVPFLGWYDDAPKNMKEVCEITNLWSKRRQ